MAPLRSPSTCSLCCAALNCTSPVRGDWANSNAPPVMVARVAIIINLFCMFKNLHNGRVEKPGQGLILQLSGLGHTFVIEPVADSSQGNQVPRTLGLRLDFLAQVRYLVIHHAIGH